MTSEMILSRWSTTFCARSSSGAAAFAVAPASPFVDSQPREPVSFPSEMPKESWFETPLLEPRMLETSTVVEASSAYRSACCLESFRQKTAKTTATMDSTRAATPMIFPFLLIEKESP